MNLYCNPSGSRTQFFAYLIAVVLTVILCLCFSSCKTTGSLSEHVNVRDSVVIRWKDSIRWCIRDSFNVIEHHVTVRDSSGVFIQFGQGGGTYNAKTGEATNVAGVQQSDTHHEQRDSTNYYRALSADYEHRADSIANEYSSLLSEYEKVTKNTRSGFDRFCSWWFWITAVLLLAKVACWVMEKIPATAPYIMIARKFVPLL